MADSFWEFDDSLLVDSSGDFIFDDTCCCDALLYYEFLRCETLEFKYVLAPTLNGSLLDPPIAGIIYKKSDKECWEYIRQIACPTDGDCVAEYDFINTYETCALCNPLGPCLDVERCDDGATWYYQYPGSLTLGDWYTDTSRCYKIIEYYPICPEAIRFNKPGVGALTPFMTVCNECICGCYETREDMPSQITAIVSGSSCAGYNGSYTLNQSFYDCSYDGGTFPLTVSVELGMDNINGGPGQNATGEIYTLGGFPTCNFEGVAVCGSQTLSLVSASSDACCTGATMEIVVPS